MSDCALCQGPLDEAHIIGTRSRFGHESRRVICPTCSLVQVSPQPTRGELHRYYSSHAYRSEHGPVPITLSARGHSRTVLPTDSDYEDALEAMASYRVDWTTKHAGLISGMRLLEIGSGDGRTLAEYAKRGLRVTGIEPDQQEAADSLKRLPKGSAVHAGTSDLVEEIEGPFDAIVMFHVLEHLHDPLSELRRLHRLLTPKGALIIEVPNIMQPNPDLEGWHFQHVHLFDFSYDTLAAMLVTAGYRVAHKARGGNLQVVARPGAGEHQIPVSGDFVAGYLSALKMVIQ